MFFQDSPIYDKKDDLLNRKSFITNLANAILNYKDKESLIFGLFGEWGIGKTSMINLLINEVNEMSKEEEMKPMVIRFNPWNFSSQEQLITQFFIRLRNELKIKDHRNTAKEVVEKLDSLSNLLTVSSAIPVFTPYTLLGSIFTRFSSKSLKIFLKSKEKSLEDYKNDINNYLEKLNKKVLIIVDDIDRLQNNEIKLIIQLIKSVADFKNTIYVLAFDRGIVEKALKDVQGVDGNEYLNKIIQVPIQIPYLSKDIVYQIFFNNLEKILGPLEEDSWDPQLWGNVFNKGFILFINNIRDVKRYLNTVYLSYSLVKKEIYEIDFLTITLIQVFLPQLYNGIKENKKFFTGTIDDRFDFTPVERKREIREKEYTEILELVPEVNRKSIDKILREVFPILNVWLESATYGEETVKNWSSQNRICIEESFDNYFKLAIPKGGISNYEFNETLLFNNFDATKERLHLFFSENRIKSFIQKLDNKSLTKIPEAIIPFILKILIDKGDIYSSETTTEINPSETYIVMIYSIIYKLTSFYKEKEKRFELLKDAILNSTESIYTATYIINHLGYYEHGTEKSENKKPEKEQLITLNQLIDLQKEVTKKIKDWAASLKLIEHKKLPYLLYRWEKWGVSNEVNKYFNDTIKDDEKLLKILDKFTSTVLSIGYEGDFGKTSYSMYYNDITHFLDDIETVYKRIVNIKQSKKFNDFEVQDKRAIDLFIDYHDNKRFR